MRLIVELHNTIEQKRRNSKRQEVLKNKPLLFKLVSLHNDRFEAELADRSLPSSVRKQWIMDNVFLAMGNSFFSRHIMLKSFTILKANRI